MVETELEDAEVRAIEEEVVDALVVLLAETFVDELVTFDPVDACDDVVEDALSARPDLCTRAITTACWSPPTARAARADPALLLSDPWRKPTTSPARLPAPVCPETRAERRVKKPTERCERSIASV